MSGESNPPDYAALLKRIGELEEAARVSKERQAAKRIAATLITKGAAAFGVRVFLGGPLYERSCKAWDSWSAWLGGGRTTGWPEAETRDLFAAVLNRVLKIGLFALFVALMPTVLLVIQTALLAQQNRKLDLQNNLVSEQNRTLTSQNALLADQNVRVDTQNELIVEQNKRVQVQTQLMEADRRSALLFELTATLDQINKELERAEQGATTRPATGWIISDRSYRRIVGLSRSLREYRFLDTARPFETVLVRDNWDLLSMEDHKPYDPAVEADQEKLTELALSPERGQLLIALIGSEIDMDRLWELNPLFSAADLREAPLSNANLRTAKLIFANIALADLSGANLSGAELVKVNARLADLRNADIRNASFAGADLSAADLRTDDVTKWAGANFRNAYLEGAQVNDLHFLESIARVTPPPVGILDEWAVKDQSAERRDCPFVLMKIVSDTVDSDSSAADPH